MSAHSPSIRCTALTFPLLACLLFTAACHKQEVKAQSNPEANPAEVSVSRDLLPEFKVGEVESHDVSSSLEVAARVETDGSRIARIGSPVAGRILKLLVLEGQYVHRGAVLATLHSTDLSDTQFAFIKAYSQQSLAEQSAHRAEQLVDADVIGRAELERRRAELLQATTELAALGTQLRSLGMTDGALRHLENTRQLNADYPVVSSISGTVLERKVTIGQIIQPAELAFLVADLSNVWLLADVPEEDAAPLRKGMLVKVKIPALPSSDIQGRLSYVSPIVDPNTRTVQVRMDLANPRGLFKPAMLASMTFVEATEKKNVVPMTAVVREENKDFVFVQTGPQKFLLREVALGAESGEYRVLESGVSPGEKIVLDGAFHLNNQRKHDALSGAGN